MIVYVVDDDSLIRQALSSLIRSVGLQVETFGSAQEFLRAPRADAPSCLVLDVRLPDGSGLDLPDELRNTDAPLPIIYITGHGTIPMTVRAMKSGALEFLTKPFRDEDLLAAIHVALERDRASRAERSELAEARRRVERLTPREREVLELVVAGKMNKQIAAQLGTAELSHHAPSVLLHRLLGRCLLVLTRYWWATFLRRPSDRAKPALSLPESGQLVDGPRWSLRRLLRGSV